MISLEPLQQLCMDERLQEKQQLLQDSLSVIISAIAYGFAAMLSFSCIWVTFETRKSNSKQRTTLLVTYITAMFLFSTGAMVQEIIYLREQFTTPTSISLVLTYPMALPLAVWGADGFLIWRCIMLFSDISKTSKILFYVVITLISITSLGGGLLMFRSTVLGSFGNIFIIFSTFICNVVLSLFIAIRLLRQSRALKNSGINIDTSVYRTIVRICVESAALIAVVSLIIVVGFFTSFVVERPCTFLLPHISVISSLLIVFRVAQGKAYTNSPSVVNGRSQSLGIQFNGNSVSTSTA